MTTGRPRATVGRTGSKRASARRGAASRARPARASTPGYHHGDLRTALLAATDALLTEAGLEGFTLREVARRAGVSHGAPAHHFGDIRGLLSAYATEGFAQLAQAMAQRRATAPPRPIDQLIATGLAYVDFAIAHRARFQLMFRSDRLDHGSQWLETAGGGAYDHLIDCIATIDPGTDPDGEARRRHKAALAWSIVHGYATLMLENHHFAAHAQGDHARALAMAESMLRGARSAFERQPPSATDIAIRGGAAPGRRTAKV